MTVLLLDNIDSFTFMLADYLRSSGVDIRVERADAIDLDQALALGKNGIVISPGPGRPEEAGISIALARAAMESSIPLLGVCLGHQAMAAALGQPVTRTAPVHGKTNVIHHDGSGLFTGLPPRFCVTRYHSLAVAEVQAPLVANAWSEDGTIMAIRHESAPAHGVQFHPESVATEQGHALIRAFVTMAHGA